MPRDRSDAPRPGTPARILEAAVDILAEQGMGSFTHRIIEQRAGVYHGATTHFFGSRDDLVDAVFAHLFALDAETVQGDPDVPADLGGVADPGRLRAMLRGGVRALFDSRRDALARYALVVHAAQHPRLQPSLAGWRDGIVARTAPILASLGAADPVGAARLLVTGADGLLLHSLSAPWPRQDGDVEALVDALIEGALTLGAPEGAGPRHPAPGSRVVRR